MILGLVGILGSPIIFLNNLTAVVAGLGIILGLIAVFGTKRILALIGVGLGIAAIAITVNVQQAAVEELDEIFNESGSVSDASDGEPSGWGDRFTWKSGVAIEVPSPPSAGRASTPHPRRSTGRSRSP